MHKSVQLVNNSIPGQEHLGSLNKALHITLDYSAKNEHQFNATVVLSPTLYPIWVFFWVKGLREMESMSAYDIYTGTYNNLRKHSTCC